MPSVPVVGLARAGSLRTSVNHDISRMLHLVGRMVRGSLPAFHSFRLAFGWIWHSYFWRDSVVGSACLPGAFDRDGLDIQCESAAPRPNHSAQDAVVESAFPQFDPDSVYFLLKSDIHWV